MSEKIKSIQHRILICNKQMPALEEFIIWREAEDNKRKNVTEWYMDLIQRSEIKDTLLFRFDV